VFIRRLILLLSIAVAGSIYYLVYTIAPTIFLLRANAAPQSAPKLFRLDLRDVPKPQPVRDFEQNGLASRPGSIGELLEEETKDLPLADLPVPESAVPPPLAEVLDREHKLERDDTLVKGVEAQLVAIPEDAARQNIEVARRFVDDTDSRILAADDVPSLTDPRLTTGSLAIPRLATSGGGGGMGPGGPPMSPGAAQEGPVDSALALMTPGAERASARVPGLDDETVIGRETVRESVQQAIPYQALDQMVHIETRTYVDPGTQDGYFELRIIPNDDASIPVLPRDVTFIVDASNSIVQRKLDLTVRGVQSCLRTLRPQDRFNIVVFSDTPKPFRESLVPATPEELAQAQAYLSGLQSGGSTDVYGAVKPVLDEAPRHGMPGIVVMVSDGRPTEGNLEGRALINALSEENRLGNTVYTFGGGNTVNQYLMDLLAYRNRGQSYVAPRIEDVDDELPSFFGRLRDALLVNLEADYAIVDDEKVFPRELPDFYRNRVVTVYGQYEPSEQKELVLRIQGNAADEQKEIVLRVDLAKAPKGTREVAEGWAFEKTYHLIGELTRRGDDPAILSEMQRLSNEFGVRTTYNQP
jgi:hypothetical protein